MLREAGWQAGRQPPRCAKPSNLGPDSRLVEVNHWRPFLFIGISQANKAEVDFAPLRDRTERRSASDVIVLQFGGLVLFSVGRGLVTDLTHGIQVRQGLAKANNAAGPSEGR